MKTRLVRIGNCRGLRLPKPLIAPQAGRKDEVELHVRDGAIVIERAFTPRAGRAEAAAKMHERNEDLLLDQPAATEFDEKEWEWQRLERPAENFSWSIWTRVAGMKSGRRDLVLCGENKPRTYSRRAQ